MSNKVVIFSAPSGSGKSTIVNHILKLHPEMEFSVSATSRAPRGQERNGVEYHFFTADERIWDKGHVIIFDVDVKGGVNLKKYFGDKALSVFIQAPSVEELRKRLVARGTDSAEAIEKRVAKAAEEMTYADKFDHILVNDNLQKAYEEAELIVNQFLSK